MTRPTFALVRSYGMGTSTLTLARLSEGIYEPVASFADDNLAHRTLELLDRHGLIDTVLVDTTTPGGPA